MVQNSNLKKISQRLKQYIFFPLAVVVLTMYGFSMMTMQMGDHFLGVKEISMAQHLYAVSHVINPFNDKLSRRIQAANSIAFERKNTATNIQTKQFAIHILGQHVLGLQTSLPVLLYHDIAITSQNNINDDNISLNNFTTQMDYLSAKGFYSLSLNEFTSAIFYHGKVATKPIMITFDNGYESLYTQVFPLLKRNNMKAVAFIPTDFVGLAGFVTWEQMREMNESGLVSFASHTKDNTPLVDIIDTQQNDALTQSKRTLEYQLQQPVLWLAYPNSKMSQTIVNAVKMSGYAGAFTMNTTSSENSIYTLPRIEITSLDSMSSFTQKLQ